MKRKSNKKLENFSSSSAFIVILILVIVSVTAIIVGGGDGFARKYIGIDFKESGFNSVLAQTGVVGKILQFNNVAGEFELTLHDIELDGSVLGANEQYVASVVPPLEGDSPFWYRTSSGGARVSQGYPIPQDFVDTLGGDSSGFEQNATEISGVVDCASNPGGSGFQVFFEDIAYETGIGFDDPSLGADRVDEVCSTLQEFETMLKIQETDLHPMIVFQSSEDGTPEHALSVVGPQYVGGSGFVSTLLADYLRSGIKRSENSFSDNVSVLGINSGFIRIDFKDSHWTVDGNGDGYDLATVVRQDMLRLLGFGSFVGHEQENILSNTWRRWTEWDRLLFGESMDDEIVGAASKKFLHQDQDEFPGNYGAYADIVRGNSIRAYYGSLPDKQSLTEFPLPAFNDLPPVFSIDTWQKGESLSGLDEDRATADALAENPNAGSVLYASHPIIGPGEIKEVHQDEKKILCYLGLAVDGVNGCDVPRSVVENRYIERENNKTICVNLFDGIHNTFVNNFQLANSVEIEGLDILEAASSFKMYTHECEEPDFDSDYPLANFDQYVTTNISQAVSFSYTPAQGVDSFREYVRFSYPVKDSVEGRRTENASVTLHKCVITANSNQLCNGDFQFSAPENISSPIDFQLPSLERKVNQNLDSGQNTDIVGCSSTTVPGWCGQGTPDVYSSAFDYTWHPYFIENPEAFDSEIIDSARQYAGGNSEMLIQRLRVPLDPNKPYLVSGKVRVSEPGLQPMFWFGTQDSVLEQPDGTFHIDYPDVVAGSTPLVEYVLTDTITPADGWVDFAFGIPTGNAGITHVGFGANNQTGYVYFDDLSIQYITECGDCLGDLNGDCASDTSDLLQFLGYFGVQCPADTIGCFGDLNFDGSVNTADMLSFLTFFGAACEVVDNEDSASFTPGTNIIALSEDDESVTSDQLDIDVELSSGDQVIPNSQGFRSNFKVKVRNRTNKDIRDLNLIGTLPAQFEYDGHIATRSDVAHRISRNTTSISRLESGEEVEIYFKVELNSNICAQAKSRSEEGYEIIKNLDLCDSYEKSIGRRSSSGRSGTSASGEVSTFQCNDGIDNDGDGLTDYPADPSCDSANDNTEDNGKEEDLAQCNDGIDNDGDGRIDYPDDHECSSISDDDEER